MAYESGAGKSEAWRRKEWKKFWNETVPKMKSGELEIPLNSNPDRLRVKGKSKKQVEALLAKKKKQKKDENKA